MNSNQHFANYQPRILLITGNMAAGKSSVAQALAEQLPKSVHLRGDIFRRMIVNGQAEMTLNLSAEAYQQLYLRYHLAVTVAHQYFQAGFTVVYQDIIIGTALTDVIAMFQDIPLSVIVLCPEAETIAARDAERTKTGYADATVVHAFDRILRAETPRLGYWLDSTNLTIQETVDQILALL
ncbi:MAG: AAA family ATPase [Oscillatoriophycideae cyanobacterium NC_groundwater_1537_Pr4_S-0.65um_50_18]|nr:AAA family ATPase [Oscillatoriophycideae cyanobacterium NC_groundwater_1537_Pr4_S-0.65um_50_18]